MRVLSKLLPMLLLPLIAGCFHTDPQTLLTNPKPGTGFIHLVSNGPAGTHKYTVFVPTDYTPSRRYPTIVFLHGIGEAGGDGIACTTVGLGPAIAKRNGVFPFIVVFPQTGMDWTSTDSENIMLAALKDAESKYSIDPNRVILTGMSSGGKGTWVLGARHPEIFSCLVPMAGFSATDQVPYLTHIPIWVLHNSGDFIVGVGNSRDMVAKIKEAGGNIQYQEFDAGGHDCWDAAYDSGELFAWMQSQQRMTR